MGAAIYPAMVFTVALLVTTTYFLLGGLPLLVLDHDTALDAKFIRAFFTWYYRTALVAAIGAAISFGALGRPAYALGAAALAAGVVVLRRRLLPAMASLGAQIQDSAPMAIRRFRQVHGLALAINLLQLAVLVWALLQFKF